MNIKQLNELKRLDELERKLLEDAERLLNQIKRKGRPEFAERVETYMREQRLLPRRSDG
jgi:hypothetical protein